MGFEGLWFMIRKAHPSSPTGFGSPTGLESPTGAYLVEGGWLKVLGLGFEV